MFSKTEKKRNKIIEKLLKVREEINDSRYELTREIDSFCETLDQSDSLENPETLLHLRAIGNYIRAYHYEMKKSENRLAELRTAFDKLPKEKLPKEKCSKSYIIKPASWTLTELKISEQ